MIIVIVFSFFVLWSNKLNESIPTIFYALERICSFFLLFNQNLLTVSWKTSKRGWYPLNTNSFKLIIYLLLILFFIKKENCFVESMTCNFFGKLFKPGKCKEDYQSVCWKSFFKSRSICRGLFSNNFRAKLEVDVECKIPKNERTRNYRVGVKGHFKGVFNCIFFSLALTKS